MKYVYVTRRARFNAAHNLWNDDWSQEKNLEVFGKCANPNWHGHNYELHVTLKGVPSEETGYCMDLKDLKDIIKEYVEEPLDHRNINLDVPWMKGIKTHREPAHRHLGAVGGAHQPNRLPAHHIRLYETEQLRRLLRRRGGPSAGGRLPSPHVALPPGRPL